jgi:hypothetical protein
MGSFVRCEKCDGLLWLPYDSSHKCYLFKLIDEDEVVTQYGTDLTDAIEKYADFYHITWGIGNSGISIYHDDKEYLVTISYDDEEIYYNIEEI